MRSGHRSPGEQSFTVTKKGQTITFDPPKDAQVHARVPLTAKANPSGLPVSFTSNTQRVCTVSGSTATTVTPGTCTITASQSGDASYAPAPDVAQSFQVNAAGQKPQTITFAPLPGTKAGEPVTLSASASSRLPVSFASSTGRVHGLGLDRHPVAARTCGHPTSPGGEPLFPAPVCGMAKIVARWTRPGGQWIGRARPDRGQNAASPHATQPHVVGEPVACRRRPRARAVLVSFASNTPAVCAVSGSAVPPPQLAALHDHRLRAATPIAAAGAVTRSFQVDLAGRR
jgi:hypothetical protein